MPLAIASPPEMTKALSVLVVEDDGMIGLLLTEMLAEMGHDVCAVEATEADAVAAAARCRPDLMIVDAWLRDGTGIGAVETILRLGPQPHLFTSGDVASVRAARSDAVVIQKPYTEVELAAAMRRALPVDDLA
jgi:DNA-binding response OmpR family regulator